MVLLQEKKGFWEKVFDSQGKRSQLWEESLQKVFTVFLGEFFQKSKQNNHIMGSFFGGQIVERDQFADCFKKIEQGW